MTVIPEVRPSPIAGLWYSGDPLELAEQVDRYLAEAKLPPLVGEVVGVIAPHAGHRYSGRTAGYAFRSVLDQERDLVVVVSPFHRFHPAPVLTTAHQMYETPLGTIEVAHDLLDELDRGLRQKFQVGLTPIANDDEHSLEIELPFLQRALRGRFRLLPLMLRSKNETLLRVLGQTLAEVVKGQNYLLVASTDLSHFYPEKVARRLDGEMLRQIARFSPEGVLQAEENGTGYACGVAAVVTVMIAAKALGANHVEILDYTTSADATGDTTSVVGYGAAAILCR